MIPPRGKGLTRQESAGHSKIDKKGFSSGV